MPRRIKVAPRRPSKYLPNASTLGYGKFKARPGDFVTFSEEMSNGNRLAVGRVVGVIEETDRDGTDFTGKEMLLVIMLSDDHSFGYEHWISVDQVRSCMDVGHARHFMAWFLNASPADLLKYRNEDPDTRSAAYYRAPSHA